MACRFRKPSPTWGFNLAPKIAVKFDGRDSISVYVIFAKEKRGWHGEGAPRIDPSVGDPSLDGCGARAGGEEP